MDKKFKIWFIIYYLLIFIGGAYGLFARFSGGFEVDAMRRLASISELTPWLYVLFAFPLLILLLSVISIIISTKRKFSKMFFIYPIYYVFWYVLWVFLIPVLVVMYLHSVENAFNITYAISKFDVIFYFFDVLFSLFMLFFLTKFIVIKRTEKKYHKNSK